MVTKIWKIISGQYHFKPRPVFDSSILNLASEIYIEKIIYG